MGIQEDIFKLEHDINQLIRNYEKYFLGLEKREPFDLLNSVDRQVRTYSAIPINNTMMKYKYNSLTAKLNTYKEHWRRTIELIEAGKYSRDRFKMEMRSSSNKPERGAVKSDPAEVVPCSSLYEDYIKARESCSLSLKGITPESVKQVIERQKPALIEKLGCKDVVFKVVVESNTPKIKAYPVR